MKIAIASVEKNVESKVSKRGGRAPYYLIFNEKKDLLETISNPFKSGGGGAGVAMAKVLGDKEINIVVSELIGEKMGSLLTEKGIKFYEKEGFVDLVLDEIIKEL